MVEKGLRRKTDMMEYAIQLNSYDTSASYCMSFPGLCACSDVT